MESSAIKQQDQTLATIIHLSVFSKLFIPFGNFIFPVIIWLVSKEKEFINHHGRNAVNFQLSLLLYYIIIACFLIATIIILGARIPNEFFEYDHYSIKIYPSEDNNFLQFLVILVTGALFFLGLIVFELYAVISAAKNASEGKEFKFPLCINFIKKDSTENEPIQ
ncbi:DUF4870 domain-containing protein [Zunongwangia profunda]|jgi:uncharacterized Tic20 family protein|uniref:DUF4870 domain-containing protein n=1 Tax=Zunongwangia profunda TaxID=398743 RepID=UPI001D1940C3|nr:DUF4870 domain-containing protein [Zunongwangia profunda]MCC4231027.1 DUF4870 domain-containing protein [Zunongwangia profunda]